jgi:hypothetical protein
MTDAPRHVPEYATSGAVSFRHPWLKFRRAWPTIIATLCLVYWLLFLALHEPVTLIGVFLALAPAGFFLFLCWLATLLFSAAWIFFHRSPPKLSQVAVAVAPAIIGIAALFAVGWEPTVRLRFLLAKPEMDRFAASVLASPSSTFPDTHVGGYYLRYIHIESGGVVCTARSDIKA